jgi:hypothetical protein
MAEDRAKEVIKRQKNVEGMINSLKGEPTEISKKLTNFIIAELFQIEQRLIEIAEELKEVQKGM